MNRNLHSSSKLTEFARTFEAQPETLLNRVVNRITSAYNSSANVPNSSSPVPSTNNCTENAELEVPESDDTETYQITSQDNDNAVRKVAK